MPANDRLRSALAERYSIERELGAGGMATVYLAHDLRHDRQVAIKVLHPELAAALGSERFLSEIKTTAKLQHPHILPLLDSGGADGLLYYVMPYVSGETLRFRLEREKQLPIPDALRIAREVADALGAAHALGIIHRDIKPENILLQGGHALVTDFGIALAVQQASGQRMTQTGLSLGTPQYMSPEQAMGERTIDARSDIYALGAVLYEMLVGEPPFTGPTVQAIVAKIMKDKPASVVGRRDRVSTAVEDAVLTALEKLPADRFASAGEFTAALDQATGTARHRRTQVGNTAPTHRLGRRGLVVVAVAGLAGVVLGGLLFRTKEPEAVRLPLRFVTKIPAGTFLPDIPGTSFALAPDGNDMVYVGQNTEGTQLFIKPMGELGASPIPGTAGATSPFYSPDGRWVAFVSGFELKRVRVGGGPVETVVRMAGAEANWGADGTIAYIGARGIEIIPAEGGAAGRITTAVVGDSVEHHWPFVVPSGDAVLFTVLNWHRGLEQAEVAVVSLKTLEVRTLVKGGFNARVLPSGHLLFARASGTLEAVRFDLRRLTLIGKPVPVLDSVRVEPAGELDIAVADNGTLVYLPASSLNRRLMQVDRSGRAKPLLDRVAFFEFPTFSPDGRQLASRIFEPSGLNLWVYDLRRGTGARLVPTGLANEPAWTPDSREVAVAVGGSLHVLAADGSGSEKVLGSVIDLQAGSWTPNGRQLLFTTQPSGSGSVGTGIKVITRGDTAMKELVGAPAAQPALSRNGRWLAYVSTETGRAEVYLRRFGGGPRQWLVSPNGGSEPRWAPDGRELFFRRGRQVIGVSVRDAGIEVVLGTPNVLFEAPYVTMAGSRMWDVSPTGQGFVMVEGHEFHDEFITVLNWFVDVSTRVGR